MSEDKKNNEVILRKNDKKSDITADNHSSKIEIKGPGDVENLNDMLSALTEPFLKGTSFLERFVKTNDQIIESHAKANAAVSKFFNNLNAFLFNDGTVPFDTSGTIAESEGFALKGTRITKEEVISMIRSLRQQGLTFNEIAEFLAHKGIPTFSGRGEWHAQTIHRICK